MAMAALDHSLPLMAAPINQARIAQHLGLSQAQVSMALRGTGRVSSATRALVLAEAERLGYRPDPMQSAFGLRHRGRARNPPVIAWIGPASEGYGPPALARAHALGYAVINIPDPDLQTLAARRVIGALVDQNVVSRLPAGFDLPAVQIGLLDETAALPIVCIDLRAGVALCLRQVRAAGFQRMRVVRMSNGSGEGAAVVGDALRGEAERLGDVDIETHEWTAVTHVAHHIAEDGDVRPLITNNPLLAKTCVDQRRPLAMLFQPQPDYSGVLVDHQAVGIVAMDLLDSRIRQSGLRLGSHHQTILVPPIWHAGESLRLR